MLLTWSLSWQSLADLKRKLRHAEKSSRVRGQERSETRRGGGWRGAAVRRGFRKPREEPDEDEEEGPRSRQRRPAPSGPRKSGGRFLKPSSDDDGDDKTRPTSRHRSRSAERDRLSRMDSPRRNTSTDARRTAESRLWKRDGDAAERRRSRSGERGNDFTGRNRREESDEERRRKCEDGERVGRRRGRDEGATSSSSRPAWKKVIEEEARRSASG